MSDTIQVDRRQDEDGRPHFNYFDPGTQLQFSWDGDFKDPIQVVHVDQGQPIDHISPTKFFAPNEGVVLPQAWLLAFQMTCDEYIQVRNLVKGD